MDIEIRSATLGDCLFLVIFLGMLTGTVGSSCLFIGIQMGGDVIAFFWAAVNLCAAVWLIGSVLPRVESLKIEMEADNG